MNLLKDGANKILRIGSAALGTPGAQAEPQALANVALSAAGGTWVSTYDEGAAFPAINAFNGVLHTGGNYASGSAYWSGGAFGEQTLERTFAAAKTISKVRMCTLAAIGDGLNYSTDPVLGVTAISNFGLTSYAFQYWDGASWADFSTPINVTNNALAYVEHAFNAVTTTKIKIIARTGGDGYVRVVEFEAWGS